MTLKNVSEVIINEFSRILEQIDSENYLACRKIATNLIRFSGMVDFNFGIFIGEVLEAIFSETDHLIGTYDISEVDREKLRTSSSTCISELRKIDIDNLKDQDVYTLLKELRIVVTKMQFNYWDIFETKERRRIFGSEE